LGCLETADRTWSDDRDMAHLRERWEGVSLPGDYTLDKWMEGDDVSGFFETSSLTDGRRAVVKVMPESASDSSVRLALWERLRAVRHPNLLQLLDCGRAELDGEIVLYGVFESTDDTLAAALGRSRLSESEAREVLTAVRDGLICLREQGLAHGALDPTQVVAVGDQIKLTTDGLRDVPADTPYREDLRALWLRISPCTPARTAEILAQVLGADPLARVARPADAASRTAPIEATAKESSATGPAASEIPAAPSRRFPRWMLAGAAVVVLVILGLSFRSNPVKVPPAPVAAPTAPVAPAVPAVVAPDPKASPFGERPKPAFQAAAEPVVKPQANSANTWRVIAYTFLSRDLAAGKVGEVNQHHPGFEATVFEPHDKKTRYLVALGGSMTRGEALRVQAKARAAGISGNVYIHDFAE
jgi:hypothetical protein